MYFDDDNASGEVTVHEDINFKISSIDQSGKAIKSISTHVFAFNLFIKIDSLMKIHIYVSDML